MKYENVTDIISDMLSENKLSFFCGILSLTNFLLAMILYVFIQV